MTHTAAAPLRFATTAMGTRFELVIAEELGDARAIGEAALEEIELWHRKLTRFSPDSLLSHINRTAHAAAVRLDRDTFDLLHDALTVRRQSDGAFDIEVGARMDELRSGGAREVAGPNVGPACVLDAAERTIRFRRAGVALDLGGIAKGHAVDAAAALLREHGVTSALLHGGTSSVAAIGAPPGEAGWKIALARVAAAPVVTLRDTTLSVSRPAAQSVGGSDHIIDPRTGRQAGDTVVAVIGRSARLGDAWATALAVLGLRPPGMPDELTTCIAQPNAAGLWSGPAAPGRD